MKLYRVEVESRISEIVDVYANSEEEAIEKYYDGEYDRSEELDRDVLDTHAILLDEEGGSM